jgi:hypothetical protein
VRSLEETGGKHPFVTGFIAGLSAPAAYFFVAEVWLGTPTGTLPVGAGLMLLVGVLLMFPDRSWLRGVGFLVGAAVFLAAGFVIGVIWIVQHTV